MLHAGQDGFAATSATTTTKRAISTAILKLLNYSIGKTKYN
jgi:hypothetical protein